MARGYQKNDKDVKAFRTKKWFNTSYHYMVLEIDDSIEFSSLILSITLKNKMPDFKVIVIVMVIGFFCYGLSIVLYVFAMRNLGSARTSALCGSAPFVGSILYMHKLVEHTHIYYPDINHKHVH